VVPTQAMLKNLGTSVDLFFAFKTCRLNVIFVTVLAQLKTQTAAVILHFGLVVSSYFGGPLIQHEELQPQFGF